MCFQDKLNTLAQSVIEGQLINESQMLWLLQDKKISLLGLLDAAYQIRHFFYGNKVNMHIINNVQNGNCVEDCNYCSQSIRNDAPINAYAMKSRLQIMQEAQLASQNGAYRHCLVFSGDKQSDQSIKQIGSVVREIKEKFAMQVCVSAGFLTDEMAATLKECGLDRYNHNLNSSENHYQNICRSHVYADRLETLRIARNHGLDVCSGIIVGLGESNIDLAQMAKHLRQVQAKSVPINFFIPILGHRVENPNPLNPSQCLRILAAFRFYLPNVEIRAAAGREQHIRSLQPLLLYPCNSLFAKGYLSTDGDDVSSTRKMIIDAGFQLETPI